MFHVRYTFPVVVVAFLSLGASSVVAAPAKPTCAESADYLVIARERSDAPGADFLIRKKSPGAKPAACIFKPQAGDLRYPKTPDDASYLMGVHKNRMVLDDGTGALRTIVIVDLATGKALLRQVSYQPPALADGKVTFFDDGPQGTRAKCPELTDDLLPNSKLEPEKILDVETLSIKPTGKIVCNFAE